MKKQLFSFILFLLTASALSASAYPPPEKDEMTIAELETKLFQFDGKVVEIEVTYAYGMEQDSADKYHAYCYFYAGGSSIDGGRRVHFDANEDAVDFFNELLKSDYASGKTSFYVYVEGKKLTAIGEKYKKSKGTYSW